MEAKEKPISTEGLVRPQQVWATLGAVQRAMILQTMVRIFQEILERKREEGTNEPAPER